MRNVADKICGESQNTHFIVNDLFFLKSGKKYVTVRQTTDDNIIRRMSFACWITKAIDMYSDYVILCSIQVSWRLTGHPSLTSCRPVSFSRRTLLHGVSKCLDCYVLHFCGQVSVVIFTDTRT